MDLWRYPLGPTLHQLLRTISLYGRWSTSGSDRDIAHFFTATRNTIERVGEKRTNGHPRTRVRNPLSGFAPKQTKESSAWWTTFIVFQTDFDSLSIQSICNFDSTSAEMHHIDAGETHGENSWAIHKNDVYCIEQIMQVTSHKSTDVRLLTSHRTNHPCKTNKACRTLLREVGITHKQPYLMDSYVWTCHFGPTCKDLHQFSTDTRCLLEDVLGPTDNVYKWLDRI